MGRAGTRRDWRSDEECGTERLTGIVGGPRACAVPFPQPSILQVPPSASNGPCWTAARAWIDVDAFSTHFWPLAGWIVDASAENNHTKILNLFLSQALDQMIPEATG